jgi:hypothetical protein
MIPKTMEAYLYDHIPETILRQRTRRKEGGVIWRWATATSICWRTWASMRQARPQAGGLDVGRGGAH